MRISISIPYVSAVSFSLEKEVLPGLVTGLLGLLSAHYLSNNSVEKFYFMMGTIGSVAWSVGAPWQSALKASAICATICLGGLALAV